jgi:NADH-quinone oxidoreductase subunit G
MDKETPMITLTIDGQTIAVPKGTTVYNAAIQMGCNIPIFCYQDRMPPFGACRVCLVEVEKFPKLQASCTLEATEGMVVRTQSSKATQGRQEIVELLLINHPLDCPICDRGGECPLQENALAHGPGKSVFVEEKRHFKKPLPLGSVLMLDRERCIACARCTRFGELVAGDSALVLKDRGYRIEVGTANNEPVESKYIGNTIMICPVGALTSQVYRFRARPWDNDVTETCCTLCPVGCSMYLDARDGEIMRTRSCGNTNINDIWLCDKGWFGYEFSSSVERLQKPLIRKEGKLREVEWQEALDYASAHIQEARISGNVAALSGNNLSVEEYFLFHKFVRESLATNNIDHRVGLPLFDLADEGSAPGMEISMGECEDLSTIILMGLDITEEFPVLWLRLKQAINRGAKAYFFGHYAPEIAPHLNQVTIHSPGEEITTLQKHLPQLLAGAIGKEALFVGTGYASMPHRREILSLLKALKNEKTSLNILEGRGNSMGARFAGVRPDLVADGSASSHGGLNVQQIINKGQDSGWDLLYTVGCDPASLYPERWKALRSKSKFIIAQDLFLTPTAQMADVVFPTLSFVEKKGSFITIGGDIQKMSPGKIIPDNLRSDGEIFALLSQSLGATFEVSIRFMRALEQAKATLPTHTQEAEAEPSPDAPKNALLGVFSHPLFDKGQRMQRNEGLLKMVKEPVVRMHPEEISKRALNHGDTVHIESGGISIAAQLKADSGVALRTLVMPLGFSDYPFGELNPSLKNGFAVEIQKDRG